MGTQLTGFAVDFSTLRCQQYKMLFWWNLRNATVCTSTCTYKYLQISTNIYIFSIYSYNVLLFKTAHKHLVHDLMP